MLFYEKIGVLKVLRFFLSGQSAFYWRRGLILYFAEMLLPSFFEKIKKRCKKLDYGYVESATNVKKNAHLNAQKFINEVLNSGSQFIQEATSLFGICFGSIFKIFIFSEVIYPKYEFIELAMKYASDHPEEKYYFHIDIVLSGSYGAQLKRFGQVCQKSNHDKIIFVFSIILAPLLLWRYWRTKGQKNISLFEKNIICNSVKAPIFDTFRELFGQYQSVRYTVSQPYSLRYTQKELAQTGITYLGLSNQGYDFLKKRAWQYIHLCFRYFSEVAAFGSNMLRLFNDIIIGRADAPHGAGNVYVTYEHFYTSRAIRNEFIRLEGSKSIFFPQTQYVSPKYYFTEFGYNYDIVCSSGEHLEDSYVINQASSKLFLPVGGYAMHRGIKQKDNYSDRILKLNAFKNNAITITILSCGLVDMSRNIEKKLMLLAKRLAHQPEIKVFVRLKSRYEMPYYDKFYSPFAKDEPSIMMTSQEYELWDFLPVTDLFITDISGSGCDMAMCGGQVMYADFLQAPDFYLFWEKISGVRVPGEIVFSEVMKWVNDHPNGPIRSARKKAMNQLKEYLGYSISDFESYKINLKSKLNTYFPPT